jgi:hypothetical protein
MESVVTSKSMSLVILAAKQPTGDFTKVMGEELRCFLWARALHWSQILWYEGKIRLSGTIYDTNNAVTDGKNKTSVKSKPARGWISTRRPSNPSTTAT